MPKADIVAQNYDLSLNRYKEVVHEDIEHRDPLEIIADLEALEAEIAYGNVDPALRDKAESMIDEARTMLQQGKEAECGDMAAGIRASLGLN